MAAKRNPGLNWETPVQGQNPRQQARFLLLVEQAAAIREGFKSEASLVVNPITRVVMEVAGVPLDQLNPAQPPAVYGGQIDSVLKTPWQENKRHPHAAAIKQTSRALLSFSCALGQLQCLTRDFPYAREQGAGKQAKYLHDGRMPSVGLAWRHLIPNYAKQLVQSSGDLGLTQLRFRQEDLAAINAAVVPAIDQLKAEQEAIREQRRDEYRDRFGHQPAGDARAAEFEAEIFEIFGKTRREFLENLGFKGKGSSGGSSAVDSPLAADYRLLGLTPGANPEEIQGAFRQLAKQHHPDAGGDAQRFQAVAAAYARIRGGQP